MFLWCKMLLPNSEKRIYNLQSKQLIKLFSQVKIIILFYSLLCYKYIIIKMITLIFFYKLISKFTYNIFNEQQ